MFGAEDLRDANCGLLYTLMIMTRSKLGICTARLSSYHTIYYHRSDGQDRPLLQGVSCQEHFITVIWQYINDAVSNTVYAVATIVAITPGKRPSRSL
jgi:hypothetical protein